MRTPPCKILATGLDTIWQLHLMPYNSAIREIRNVPVISIKKLSARLLPEFYCYLIFFSFISQLYQLRRQLKKVLKDMYTTVSDQALQINNYF